MLVARLKVQIAAWFLGPDRLAAAERHVTTLASQRQDILDAVASERRRIERNLHDGVQQQLVAIGLDLGMAEHHLDSDPGRARELIVSARHKVQGSIAEMRQIGRGLHPAILEDRGIDAALSAIVSNAPIPISVHVDPDLDLSTDVAETVYFVVNEALANVMKHANARVASVHVSQRRRRRPRDHPRRRRRGRRSEQGHRHRRNSGPHQRRRRHRHRELAPRRPDDGDRADPAQAEGVMTDTTSAAPIRTIVADDSVLLRDGVVRLLSDSGFDVVAASAMPRRCSTLRPNTIPTCASSTCACPRRIPTRACGRRSRSSVAAPRWPCSCSRSTSKSVRGRVATGNVSGVGYLLKDRVIDVDDFLASFAASPPAAARSTPR